MKQEERLDQIAEILSRQSLLTVQDICELFHVSRDTARRDLVLLEEQGRITRTRGGAVSPKVRSFSSRHLDNELTKKKIARAASSYIQEGDVIFMDSSTTVSYLSEFISDMKLTVITASLHIAQSLARMKHVEVYLPGGKLNKEEHFVQGSMVIKMLELFRADLALLGTCGIHEGEVVVIDAEDCLVKQQMISRSEKVLLLTDHSKVGLKMPFCVSPLKDIDVLITDSDTGENRLGLSRPKHIEWV
ncbi:DeoR/GlpR family DNA-binding transcription regulator [Paenibacillus sp. sptzw28]|uniref:DeoR/GlpR family DNA-binding transcription regulator n=1 Tax=Paenibacillus sp. sptzw28 TaxID=715179 RepID=UPI001C6F585A|nr:DeoR/GlpR family DNA-binding transcription regulator [Paenibacillus sp. sptzw28]QYR22665.1 DeoR/GlpR family DNA-binding transcription regulator [Paenibacillus sp. sptzw28]